MKHPAEEELFMLAHGSMSLPSAIRVFFHMRRCERCAARFREFKSMSAAVAGAVRGMPQKWHPFDRTLRMQALVAVLVIGATVYGVQRAIVAYSEAPEPWHNASEGACLTPEEEAALARGEKPRPLKDSKISAVPAKR